MFSSLDPDHPYRISRDTTDARKESAREIAKLFYRGRRGHTLVTQIVCGEVSPEIGLEKIRKMLRDHADSIPYPN